MATIVIDPGHFTGYNPGVCPGYYEGDRMFVLAEFLGDYLKQMGATVRYTKSTAAANPSLEQRGALGAGSDLFISLHSDAFDNPTARGVTMFYSVRQPEMKNCADSIGAASAQAMGNEFRGSITRTSASYPGQDYYGVMRAAVAAGAKRVFLLENGFHTNMQDCMFLSNDANLKALACALAKAIGACLGISTPPDCSGGCSFNHIVQSGDTLWNLAERYQTDWQRIAALNGLSAPYLLTIGQVLRIPADCRMEYHVMPGDTLYTIGARFGVRWQDIAAANGLTAPYLLTVGQCLVIPLR